MFWTFHTDSSILISSDDCRFPHVMPDGNAALPGHHAPYFAGRGGGPRQPRGHGQPNGNGNGNGLEEKFNNMNIRDVRDLP